MDSPGFEKGRQYTAKKVACTRGDTIAFQDAIVFQDVNGRGRSQRVSVSFSSAATFCSGSCGVTSH